MLYLGGCNRPIHETGSVGNTVLCPAGEFLVPTQSHKSPAPVGIQTKQIVRSQAKFCHA